MRFGVLILPESSWSVGQQVWCRAEELGFDHAWTYDHLAWRSLRDAAWFGAVPTLTGLFELARFSHRELGRPDHDRALGALHEITVAIQERGANVVR